MSTAPDPATAPAKPTADDERVAHLVLRDDWPVALCGATVSTHLGESAAGRDRCPGCLNIAWMRGLGRPAWAAPERTT